MECERLSLRKLVALAVIKLSVEMISECCSTEVALRLSCGLRCTLVALILGAKLDGKFDDVSAANWCLTVISKMLGSSGMVMMMGSSSGVKPDGRSLGDRYNGTHSVTGPDGIVIEGSMASANDGSDKEDVSDVMGAVGMIAVLDGSMLSKATDDDSEDVVSDVICVACCVSLRE